MELTRSEFDSVCSAARSDLISFCCAMYNQYAPAEHHFIIAEALEKIERGELTRLIIAMPPRHGKSMLASQFFPSWFVGRNPTKQIITTSATSDLATDFGRFVKTTVQDELYSHIFPDVYLRKDSKANNKFITNKGGIYHAVGMGGTISGRGAHLLIIDDPIKNRADADSEGQRKNNKDWYSSVAYPRLMPGNSAIIVIQTRWHEDDLAGWLMNEHNHENWTVLELPAMNEETNETLWPEAFDYKAMNRIKQSITQREWNSLYMQRPSDAKGNILKRQHWRKWPQNKPFPNIEYTLQSYDTAFSDKDVDTASRSARTTWGVFKREDNSRALLLLEAWADRVDYPNLKHNFLKNYKEWKPEKVIIEKKASGQSLIQDLRRSGIPVSSYNPDKDKISRAYAVQALLEAGLIYYPDRRWAEDVIEELAKFPTGKTDDYVDTATQAWLFFRQSSMLELKTDWSAWDRDTKRSVAEDDDDDDWGSKKKIIQLSTFRKRGKGKRAAYG